MVLRCRTTALELALENRKILQACPSLAHKDIPGQLGPRGPDQKGLASLVLFHVNHGTGNGPRCPRRLPTPVHRDQH